MKFKRLPLGILTLATAAGLTWSIAGFAVQNEGVAAPEAGPALSLADYATTESEVGPDAMKMASNIQRSMLATLAGRDASDPLVGQLAACWAEGSDPTVMGAFEDLLGAKDDVHSFQFSDGSRWSNTATDGFGLGQGDPTNITWSFIPDGTFIPGYIGEPGSNSSVIAFLDGVFGAGPGGADLTLRPWFTYFQQIFDNWASFTGLRYVYEPNDDGAAFVNTSGSLGVRGDVRIGGHFIDGASNVLAYNFFPNTGDMVLDTADGALFGNAFAGFRAFRNVLAHEHGHGIGINHVCPVNQTKLMEPFISTAFDMVQLDDIMAGSRGYGDTNEYPNENDTPGTATDIGALNDGDFYLQNSLTVDDNSDEDWFKMTVPAGSEMSVVLIPYGGTYLSGPQNANGSCSPGSSVNYTEQTDLSFDIVDSDMSTVIASGNTQPIGVIEQLNNISLPSGAGDYYVRVYGPGVNLSQLYQVRIDIDVVVTNNPPVAVCQDVDSCDGNVVAADVDNGSSDPDLDPLNFTLEPAGPYAPGQTVVNLIVDDGALADTCQATITVNQAPTAICQNISVMGDSLGCVVAVPADSVDGGSFDPDLDPLTLTLDPAGPYAEGVNVVSLIVSDSCGAADTCQATITVTCPDGPMLAVDPGSVLFAGVVLGDTACAKVTVYNTGDLDMTISSITGCGTAPFYVDQTGLSTTVTPGDSTCFEVCVAPTGTGPDSCQVQIVTDGGNETIDVSLASVTSVPGDAISTSVVLSPVFPNPFASRAQIRFTLPDEGRVDLDVFDMNGRRIRSLYSGTKASGDHTMTWDGRNSAGREVAGGIYFLRLNHKSGQQVVRAVKVE